MTALEISERERLLLGAALRSDAVAAISDWERWASQIALEDAPYPELRLLTAVYANLSRVAPSYELPRKLKGKRARPSYKTTCSLKPAFRSSTNFQSNVP